MIHVSIFIVSGKVGLTAKASRRQNSGSDSSSAGGIGDDGDGKLKIYSLGYRLQRYFVVDYLSKLQ